jgi:hypothetical protein
VTSVIGTFDAAGRLHNPTEKTWKLPDIGLFAGAFPGGKLASGMVVEVHDRTHRHGVLNWFKVDAVVAEQRLGIMVGRKLFPVIDLTVGLIFSRDFETDQFRVGLGVSLIKF